MKIGEKGEITYTKPEYGEITFSWERNPLTNSMMYWTSYSPTMYVGTKSTITKIVKHIESNYLK